MAKLKGIFKRVAKDFFNLPRVKTLELKSGPHAGKYNTPQLRKGRVTTTIPSEAVQAQRRAAFGAAGGPRDQFLASVRKNASTTELQALGWTPAQIKAFTDGDPPPRGFEVHHRVPIKADGDNTLDNLVLIRTGPDHKLITAQQNSVLNTYGGGDRIDVELPTTPPGALTWPKPGTHPYPTR